jgi:hypothetical protein
MNDYMDDLYEMELRPGEAANALLSEHAPIVCSLMGIVMQDDRFRAADDCPYYWQDDEPSQEEIDEHNALMGKNIIRGLFN